MGGADGGLALLGLGHLVGVAVIGGDEERIAIFLSAASMMQPSAVSTAPSQ